MEIDEFIEHLKNSPLAEISRGSIIDHLAGHEDNWILVLKALIIKNPRLTIHTNYLVDKLNFMHRNPDQQSVFLDFYGINIYRALKAIKEGG